MNNADKFKQVFDLYATELWAMSEKDFLAWLNAECDVPDTNVGELISKQMAIEAVKKAWMDGAYYTATINAIKDLPTIDPVNHGARMEDDWEEPEINPCRGCDDYDGRGGCKSHGGCGEEKNKE